MILYVLEGYENLPKGRETTESLVYQCLDMYLDNCNGIDQERPDKILRQLNGKPYFDKGPVHFSVSHSADYFVCLMDRDQVGVDIQENKDTDYQRVCNRFYTEEEKEYVKAYGALGFWQIWTRKEAYVKYMGDTLGRGFKAYCTVKNSQLAKEIDLVNIGQVYVAKGYTCSYAWKNKGDLIVRTILLNQLTAEKGAKI